MGLFLQLLQVVLIGTQLLKEATTNATATATTTATAVTTSAITSKTEKLNTGIATNVAQTSSPSVNDTTPTTDNQTSPFRSPTIMNTASSADTGTTTVPLVKNTLTLISTSNKSQPKSVSQSIPSTDLHSTQSKASNYITGVPKRTQSINSSYGTSSMIFTNSGSATLLVSPTTTEQTSSPSVNDTTPTPQVSPSSSVLHKLSSSQSGNTTQSASTTLNSTTTTQGFSASSMWKISSDNQTSPLSTPKAMNTTSSVDAGTSPFRSPTIMNTASSADTGTTTVPLVKNTLTSISTSNKSQPKSVSQSTPSTDLNSTQSKASSYITGVPNQTLSINSSYGTSPMILTNSGSATTQAVYFTSDHPTKESSSLLVAHTTTDSFTKLTSAISVSVSLNWTDWSVDSGDCQRHCSNMGGTVTASRRCYSHNVTFEKSICTKYNISTKVFKCGQQHCPISGTTLLGVSISTVLVGTLLHMLPNFFGG